MRTLEHLAQILVTAKNDDTMIGMRHCPVFLIYYKIIEQDIYHKMNPNSQSTDEVPSTGDIEKLIIRTHSSKIP